VVLGLSARNSVATCVLLGFAVLAGQLSVGWSNDRLDMGRDRAVDHQGKPLATGAASPRVVEIGIAVSAVATIALSLLLGWRAGWLHIGAVAVAWLYNVRLKSTPLSWLPYALSFGALPAVATMALPTHPAPAAWIVAAAALIGTAVNFVNAVPMLAEHPASDVHGLPDRLGGRTSLLVAASLLAINGIVVAVCPESAPTTLSWTELAVTAVAVLVGTAAFWRLADTRRPFYGLLGLAAVQMLAAVLVGTPLH
jgi:4-hydroxybenzoate polyprenyltransferase